MRNSVKKLISQTEKVIKDVEGFLDSAIERDDEGAITRLEDELEQLNDAWVALNNIE